jgi:hypothetical protein
MFGDHLIERGCGSDRGSHRWSQQEPYRVVADMIDANFI